MVIWTQVALMQFSWCIALMTYTKAPNKRYWNTKTILIIKNKKIYFKINSFNIHLRCFSNCSRCFPVDWIVMVFILFEFSHTWRFQKQSWQKIKWFTIISVPYNIINKDIPVIVPDIIAMRIVNAIAANW